MTSKIEWTETTLNPVVGCSVISPGCRSCYAMRMAGTRLKHNDLYKGLTQPSKAGPVWNGQLRLSEKALTKPLGWRKPRMIFVNSMGDLFHEGMPDEWIDRVFAVMALTPQHTYQVLTKRPERMREYIRAERYAQIARHARYWEPWAKLPHPIASPLPNVWLGTSVEDQTRADERIPHLLATPAAVRFLSCEPLLGPVRLDRITLSNTLAPSQLNTLTGKSWPIATGISYNKRAERVDQVIVGGESGPGARPMHPDWARTIRDQCKAAGVPFFMKQMARKGAIPDDLRVREYPEQ